MFLALKIHKTLKQSYIPEHLDLKMFWKSYFMKSSFHELWNMLLYQSTCCVVIGE